MIDTTAGKSFAPVDSVNTVPTTKQAAPSFGSEEQLEAAIQAASDRMCAAPERADKLRHWREMCRLIDQRTPERRRFMERTQGLA